MKETAVRPRPGGRKTNPRLAEVTVVLDTTDVAVLDGLAAELGRSRSDLIREAIRSTWLKGRRQRGG